MKKIEKSVILALLIGILIGVVIGYLWGSFEPPLDVEFACEEQIVQYHVAFLVVIRGIIREQ